jgi:hypothetical protein
LHDTVDLETRGIPAVYVATTEFVDGARTQAKALGADPVGVFVTHPIQDRTDEEMASLADAFAEHVIAGLLDES